MNSGFLNQNHKGLPKYFNQIEIVYINIATHTRIKHTIKQSTDRYPVRPKAKASTFKNAYQNTSKIS